MIAIGSALLCGICAAAAGSNDFSVERGETLIDDSEKYYPVFGVEAYSGEDTTVFISREMFESSIEKNEKFVVSDDFCKNSSQAVQTIIFDDSVDCVRPQDLNSCDTLKNLIFLGKDTFVYYISDDDRDVVMYGTKGSNAEKYAEEHYIPFEYVSDAVLGSDAAEPLSKPVVTKKCSEESVRLSWKPVAGAKKYTIYAKKSGEDYKKVGVTSGKSFTVKNIEFKKTYKFKVEAHANEYACPTENSSTSKAVSAKVTGTKLDVPKVTYKKFGSTSVRLAWNKIPGATEYVIYYAQKGDKKFTPIKTVTDTNYTFIADKASTYYFKVMAQKAADGEYKGSSDRSAQVTVKLNANKLVVKDTGYYRDAVPGDPEYDAGILKAFVNGSHKAGEDIPAGYYIINTDKENAQAFVAKGKGVASDIAKPQSIVGTSGHSVVVYVPDGMYLTMIDCTATLYNAKVAIPSGVFLAGKKCKAGDNVNLKLTDEVPSYTSQNVLKGYAGYYYIIDTASKKKSVRLTTVDVTLDQYKKNKTSTITLKEGEILAFGDGIKLLS